jgi:ketosteroid isomerase-like protein
MRKMRRSINAGKKEVTVESPNARLVRDFMQHYTDLASFDRYLAPDIEYISLNWENPELRRIMPWAGSHKGIAAFRECAEKIAASWDILSFDFERVMAEGDDVAAFGRFAYETKILKQRTHSPFAIWAKVRDGKIHFFQFLEDTYNTSASFRKRGNWSVSNVNGELEVGTE